MSTIPKKMSAVLTTGHGGFEMLEFRNDVLVPLPKSDQVLIKVLGAGINNTDINTIALLGIQSQSKVKPIHKTLRE